MRIHACPVDAIVGSPKQMHTVLTGFCTGCDLCVPPCPVDCIDMVELEALAGRGNRHATALDGQSVEDMAAIARSRYQFHQLRLEREKIEREQHLTRKAEAKLAHLESLTIGHDLDRKKAAVRAAIERARARVAGQKNNLSAKTKS
jgi:electron transport complex protein RnfB